MENKYKNLRILISGTVQGVGFRPFIYRIANESNLYGYIQNKADGIVEICVQGKQRNIDLFIKKIKEERPSLARYEHIDVSSFDKERIYDNFSIIESSSARSKTGSLIHPDISICNKCLVDFFQNNRRYHYPFISCTECGPKFTTLRNLPYDRANTTMSDFPMCKKCQSEYNDPNNRFFHYELISCKNADRIFIFATTKDM